MCDLGAILGISCLERAIDSPCKALGGWRTQLGPGGALVGQHVGKVRGGRVNQELEAVQGL